MSRRFEANVDDCEEDSDDDNGVSEQNNKEITKTKKKKTKSLFGGGCCSYNSTKRAVFSPINKVYRRFSSSSSEPSTRNSSKNRGTGTSRESGTRSSGNYAPSCCLCLCMSKPKTLETSLDDIDLDDPSVDIESSLTVLLEQNDFYCAECNTHLVD